MVKVKVIGETTRSLQLKYKIIMETRRKGRLKNPKEHEQKQICVTHLMI